MKLFPMMHIIAVVAATTIIAASAFQQPSSSFGVQTTKKKLAPWGTTSSSSSSTTTATSTLTWSQLFSTQSDQQQRPQSTGGGNSINGSFDNGGRGRGRGGRGRGRGGGRGGRDGRFGGRDGRFGGRGGRFGGRGGGGGGGGGPVLKLTRPSKLVRQVLQQPLTDEEREHFKAGGGGGGGRGGGRGGGDRNERGGGRGRGQGRGGRGGGRGGGDGGGGGRGPAVASAGDAAIDTSGFRGQRRGRGNAGRNDRRGGGGGRANGDDGPRGRRTSLRLGTTSRKGRSAELSRRRGSLRKRDRSAERAAREEAAIERRTIQLPEGPMSVGAISELLDEKPAVVIKFLMTNLGVMAAISQNLDPSTCVALVEGFGRVVGSDDDFDDDEDEDDDWDEDSALATGIAEYEDDPESLQPRPPVVTIMGHVDHGKTSLLDTIRETSVTAGEFGGITQAISTYQVGHKDKKITFVDTPGHAAFTDMRERGANITDIIVLVVAADDGVKQQTADSIACARQAGVPLVVAINKCDLETADPNRVMTELTSYDVLTEEFGGEILASEISAKEGTNIDALLDKIMLQAEIQDISANPDRDAECIVIEANVEKGLGTVATCLVKKGTLRVGDVFVAGGSHGKVRALISTANNDRSKEAGPSMPIRVVGFEGMPQAGDILVVAEDEQLARELAESRQRIARERQSMSYQTNLMGTVAQAFASNKEVREMCVVVKADVQGSAEALTRALRELKLENDEAIVTIKVLVSEAGEVTKSDIAIASVAEDTTVLAFNVPASYAAMEDARMIGVGIEYYNIIYDAIESVECRMQEVLSPTPQGEYSGSAAVQEVFNIGGTGNIAGSRCDDGYLKKGSNVRVMRGDKILMESIIKSLRNFKAEVDRIEAGNECGIGLIDFESFEPGDVIECYVE